MTAPGSRRDRRLLSVGEIVAIVLIPVAIAATCLVVDLRPGDRVIHKLPRASLLALYAGFLSLSAMIAALPWWTVSRERGWRGVGGVVIGFEIALAISVLLMILIALLHDEPRLRDGLAVHAVVLGVGVLLIGVTAILRMILRNNIAAALTVMLMAFAAASTPFWSRPIALSVSTATRQRVLDVVVNVTPLSACSDAVGYELFHGEDLYRLSQVPEYHRVHVLPDWWKYALVVGGAGVVLIGLSGLVEWLSGRARVAG